MNKNYLLLTTFLFLALATSQAQINDIVNFTGTSGAKPGAYPYGSLTRLGNILYGMTYQGGQHNVGCIFAVDTNGDNYRVLLSFNDTTGLEPRGSLLLNNGVLYGMTTLGGGSDLGNVFRIDTGGNNYQTLLDFTIPQGRGPWGSLIILGDDLYGMTQGGGAYNEGVIFSIDTNGNNYRKIYDFGDSAQTGRGPEGDLIFVNGKFYGMTEEGGDNFMGTVFSIDSNGQNYTKLVDFNGAGYPQGAQPKGSLTYAAGVLYGLVEQGAANNIGCVFSVDTDGTGYKDLLDFNGTNGNDPTGSLLLSGGTLYGATEVGGANGQGVIFSIDTSGNNYQDLIDLSGADGGYPSGSVLLAGGALYATAYQGGANDYGAVFSTSICNLKVSIDSGVFTLPCYGDSTGQAIAVIVRGTPPYVIQWSGGAGNLDTASGLSAGNYTVSVTDNIGCANTATVTITQPGAISVQFEQVGTINCFGDSTGAAIASASGGVAPYNLQWNNAALSADTAVNLAAGTYTITVTDFSGCTTTASTTIGQPAALSATPDSEAQMGSNCNGSATLAVAGGTPPYSYMWQTGGQTADSIVNQCAGNYCCLITDSNGCTLNTCVRINMINGINTVADAVHLSIYPEPTSGYFTVEGLTVNQVIELYDYNGQKLSGAVVTNASMHFDISDKANGIYLIRILSEEGTIVAEKRITRIL